MVTVFCVIVFECLIQKEPAPSYVVTGRNKMTKNLSEAIARTRNIAVPLDVKRLGRMVPCSKLGHCIDCHYPERICNDFVCIEGQFDVRQKGRFYLSHRN